MWSSHSTLPSSHLRFPALQGRLFLTVHRAKDLKSHHNSLNHMSPHVSLVFHSAIVCSNPDQNGNTEPDWKEETLVLKIIGELSEPVEVEVFDGEFSLGMMRFALYSIINLMEGQWYCLTSRKHPGKRKGSIQLSWNFMNLLEPVQQEEKAHEHSIHFSSLTNSRDNGFPASSLNRDAVIRGTPERSIHISAMPTTPSSTCSVNSHLFVNTSPSHSTLNFSIFRGLNINDADTIGWVDFKELTFISILGEGGSAIVYSGEYRNAPVAIKLLKEKILRPTELSDFSREVTCLRLARHPNIVLFMGVCFNPCCIVTELLDTNLYNLLYVYHTSFTLFQQLYISLAISRAVVSLHSHNPPYIHRDLKSQNVLLSHDLRLVKICDFGLIKKMKERGISLHAGIGTPLWMCPEMLRGEGYDLSADIYSLGLIFYEIHAEQLPFDGETNPIKLMQRIGVQEESPMWPEKNLAKYCSSSSEADVEKKFRNLIEQCWDYNSSRRPICKEVVKRLNQLMSILEQGYVAEKIGTGVRSAATRQDRGCYSLSGLYDDTRM